MSEKTPEKNASTTAEVARGEEAYVVRPELVQEIHDALDTANIHRVEELVQPLHHADLADLIEMLAPEDRKVLIEIIRAEFDQVGEVGVMERPHKFLDPMDIRRRRH